MALHSRNVFENNFLIQKICWYIKIIDGGDKDSIIFLKNIKGINELSNS